MVGKWEQIEQEAREDQLKDLERELHGEQERGRKPKPKHRRSSHRHQRKTEPGAQDTGSARDGSPDDKSSDG
jgi:hypothetical protein